MAVVKASTYVGEMEKQSKGRIFVTRWSTTWSVGGSGYSCLCPPKVIRDNVAPRDQILTLPHAQHTVYKPCISSHFLNMFLCTSNLPKRTKHFTTHTKNKACDITNVLTLKIQDTRQQSTRGYGVYFQYAQIGFNPIWSPKL